MANSLVKSSSRGKKGISPLIAAVVLIGFVVAIALLLSGFFSGFVRKRTTKVAKKGEKMIECDTVRLSSAQIRMENLTEGRKLTLSIHNSGSKIKNEDFGLSLILQDGSKEKKSITDDIPAGGSTQFPLKFNGTPSRLSFTPSTCPGRSISVDFEKSKAQTVTGTTGSAVAKAFSTGDVWTKAKIKLESREKVETEDISFRGDTGQQGPIADYDQDGKPELGYRWEQDWHILDLDSEEQKPVGLRLDRPGTVADTDGDGDWDTAVVSLWGGHLLSTNFEKHPVQRARDLGIRVNHRGSGAGFTDLDGDGVKDEMIVERRRDETHAFNVEDMTRTGLYYGGPWGDNGPECWGGGGYIDLGVWNSSYDDGLKRGYVCRGDRGYGPDTVRGQPMVITPDEYVINANLTGMIGDVNFSKSNSPNPTWDRMGGVGDYDQDGIEDDIAFVDDHSRHILIWDFNETVVDWSQMAEYRGENRMPKTVSVDVVDTGQEADWERIGAFEDLDGDGVDEIAFGNNGRYWMLHVDSGEVTQLNATQYYLIFEGESRADVDQDGKTEFLVSNDDSSRYAIQEVDYIENAFKDPGIDRRDNWRPGPAVDWDGDGARDDVALRTEGDVRAMFDISEGELDGKYPERNCWELIGFGDIRGNDKRDRDCIGRWSRHARPWDAKEGRWVSAGFSYIYSYWRRWWKPMIDFDSDGQRDDLLQYTRRFGPDKSIVFDTSMLSKEKYDFKTWFRPDMRGDMDAGGAWVDLDHDGAREAFLYTEDERDIRAQYPQHVGTDKPNSRRLWHRDELSKSVHPSGLSEPVKIGGDWWMASRDRKKYGGTRYENLTLINIENGTVLGNQGGNNIIPDGYQIWEAGGVGDYNLDGDSREIALREEDTGNITILNVDTGTITGTGVYGYWIGFFGDYDKDGWEDDLIFIENDQVHQSLWWDISENPGGDPTQMTDIPLVEDWRLGWHISGKNLGDCDGDGKNDDIGFIGMYKEFTCWDREKLAEAMEHGFVTVVDTRREEPGVMAYDFNGDGVKDYYYEYQGNIRIRYDKSTADFNLRLKDDRGRTIDVIEEPGTIPHPVEKEVWLPPGVQSMQIGSKNQPVDFTISATRYDVSITER